MSKISTIYDAILTRLGTVFSAKTRIPNAYSLKDNVEQFLRDSYGLRVDDGSYLEGEYCTLHTQRTFTIVFTEEIIRQDSEFSQYDTVVKSILEDVVSLQLDFYRWDELGVTTSVEIVTPTGTSGIRQLFGEKSNFLYIEVGFNINVREQLT